MVSTFVDTSVWFAAASTRDRNNGLAESILLSLEGWTLTDHVLVETWQLLSARFGREVADTFWGRLRESGAVVEPVTASDLETASRIEALVRTKSIRSSTAPASPSWSGSA